MTYSDFTVGADALRLHRPDGTADDFPTIWLRDNCPSGFHPQTHERVADLMALDDAPELAGVERIGTEAVLTWADGHVSRFALGWLEAHRPGQAAPDPAAIPPTLWRGTMMAAAIPRHRGADLMADDAALGRWMTDTRRTGLSIVDGLAPETGAGRAIAERIGFLRETNFGRTFEVVNRPDPNNLAYTAHALPLHTDLPNQEVPPGYQFLHCLANDAVGGGSVFADGFAIARHLRDTDRAAFELLCTVPIPFRFHDAETDIRVHRPVITLDAGGEVCEIRFNAHIAAPFDMAAALMPAYYRAYRAYMACTRSADFLLTCKLSAGEMAVFDNRRVLHGRAAFDPSTGFRHLHGCYVDRGEFDARLRKLAGAASRDVAA